ENEVVLDEEQLLFILGGQNNTFDNDVDKAPAPTTQTMFMANLSSVDLIYDEASLSYDSDIQSKVQDHDNYLDSVDEYQEVHDMHYDGQQNYVVNSDAEYSSYSNIILYDQYVKNKAKQVVQINDKVVNASLTVELARYKEQVAIYEKRQDDTLEIAEKTRKKMLEKMKSPLRVKKGVKIAPPDYLKENYLATFTPQRHLTPEQIFWSLDILVL
nr:hypothetical protein [Tanacetum cinerariifolium]